MGDSRGSKHRDRVVVADHKVQKHLGCATAASHSLNVNIIIII